MCFAVNLLQPRQLSWLSAWLQVLLPEVQAPWEAANIFCDDADSCEEAVYGLDCNEPSTEVRESRMLV